MDRVLSPCQSHCLSDLFPFDSTQPIYKRQMHETSPISHRGLIKLLGMSTIYDTSELPLSPSSALGEESLGDSFTTTLWTPGTPTYINLHVSSPSFPIGINHFEFTLSSDHIPNFSSRWSCTDP